MALSEVAAKFTADISDFQSKMKQVNSSVTRSTKDIQSAGRSFQNVGNSIKNVGAGMTAGITLPLVGAGAAAIKTAADFEASMSEVAAVTGATGKEFSGLSEMAKELGATTKFSATEAAQGMAFLGRAGFSTTEIMSAMPSMLDLAAAGNLDLARASDIASNVLSGFGMEAGQAGHMTDVLAFAAANSNTSVEQMGNAMSYVGPIANSLGISLEETAAAVGILSDAGIQGEKAGTALRGIMGQLGNVTGQTEKTLAKYGLTAEDVNPKTKSLAEIIQTLADAGLTGADAMELVGQEAGPGLAVLLEQGSSGLTTFTEELEKSEGTASKMAKTMADNTKGGFKEFTSALESLGIAIGDILLPVLNPIVKKLTSLARSFKDLHPAVQTTIVVLGLIAAAVGPLLVVVGSIVSALGALSVAFGVTVGAVATTIGWILAIIAAVVALVVGIYYLVTNWDTVWAAIKETAFTVWNAIKAFFAATWEAIVAMWDAVWNGIKVAWTALWNGIKTVAMAIWNGIKAFLAGIWNGIKNTATAIWNGIKNFVVGAFQWMYNHNYYFKDLVDAIAKAWDWVKSKTSALWNSIKSFLVGLWNSIKSAATSAWSALKSAIQSGWNSIKSVTTSVWNSIKSFLSGIWNGLKSLISSVWNSIKSATSSAWNSIKSTISNVASSIKSALSGLASKARSWGSNMMNMFLRGIKSKISAIVSSVKGVAKKIAGYLGFHSPTKYGPAADSDKWMPNMMNMFTDGIKKNIPKVSAMAAQVASELSNLDGMSASPYVNPTVRGLSVSSAGTGVTGGGSNIVINFNGNVRNDGDIRKIAVELDKLQERKLRASGRTRRR